MPAFRPTLWHSVNTLVAVCGELATFQLAIFEIIGHESEPIKERLRVIMEILPRLLNLRDQSVPDGAVDEQAIEIIEVPINEE